MIECVCGSPVARRPLSALIRGRSRSFRGRTRPFAPANAHEFQCLRCEVGQCFVKLLHRRTSTKGNNKGARARELAGVFSALRINSALGLGSPCPCVSNEESESLVDAAEIGGQVAL